MVAERRNRLRQLDNGVADGGALPAQVVGGGIDERTQRAHAARLGGLEQFGQPLKLGPQVVPLDRHRGAVLRDDRAVGHRGPAGVGRRQLDRPARHQLRRQDRGVGIGGDFVLAIEPERDLRPQRLRFDLDDLAHRHAADAHVVTGEHAVAVVEIADHHGSGGVAGGSHRNVTPATSTPRAPSPTRTAQPRVTAGLPDGSGRLHFLVPPVLYDSTGLRRAGGPGGGPPGGGAGGG